MVELRGLLTKFPPQLLLKDLCLREDRIGNLSVEMLLQMIDEGQEEEEDKPGTIKEEDEEDVDEDGEARGKASDDDSSSSDAESEDEQLGLFPTSDVLGDLALDPEVAQEVFSLLMQFQSQMRHKNCNCEPGKPHTCMSPAASRFASQITSLAHSIGQSLQNSVANTAHHSRRQSLSRIKARLSVGSVGVIDEDKESDKADEDEDVKDNLPGSDDDVASNASGNPVPQSSPSCTSRGLGVNKVPSSHSRGMGWLRSSLKKPSPSGSPSGAHSPSGGDAGAGPSLQH
jgi:hypothetical protein